MSQFGNISMISRRAVDFGRRYYDMLDNTASREQLLQLYPEGMTDLMDWNGHKLGTQADIRTYVASLPKTKHVMETLDAQPLPGNREADLFILVVSGTVTYDDEHSRAFYQRLVLRELDGKLYIINDYFRWTAEVNVNS